MRLWSSDPVGSAVTDTAGRFEIDFSGRGRFRLAVERLEESGQRWASVSGRFDRPVVVMRRGQMSMQRADCTPRILIDWNEVAGAAEELDFLIDIAVVAGNGDIREQRGRAFEFGGGRPRAA